MWTDWHHYSLVERAYRERFLQKALIIWNNALRTRHLLPHSKYELLLFGVNGSSVATWNACPGRGSARRLVGIRDPVGEYAHPTQKPCELAERAITNSSAQRHRPGPSRRIRFDPDCRAPNRPGRAALQAEPQMGNVILRRFKQYTGIKPKRVLSDGTTEPVTFLGEPSPPSTSKPLSR